MPRDSRAGNGSGSGDGELCTDVLRRLDTNVQILLVRSKVTGPDGEEVPLQRQYAFLSTRVKLLPGMDTELSAQVCTAPAPSPLPSPPSPPPTHPSTLTPHPSTSANVGQRA